MDYKILLAFDGSESSVRGAAYALQLLERNPAVKVTALTVALPVANLVVFAPLHGAMADLEKASLKEAGEIQEKVKAMFEKAGRELETAVIQGEPSQVICKFAEEGNCDFIIIGTRGRGRNNSVIMGGTTRKVIHGASCPVTVVPPPATGIQSESVETPEF